MRTSLITILLVMTCGWNGFAALDALPPLQVPDCLGVNIHFIEPQEDSLDLIDQAGFRLIRMDFGWAHVEKEKGEYDFSGYERLAASLQKRGMMPLFILDYSNPLYEKGQSVVTEEGRKAFARFAANAVKAIQGGPVLWEIWNEPNIKQFWEKPNPEAYVLLVKEASKAMREANPQCTILAPATSEIDMDFLGSCFEQGLLEWIDAVTVHPYRTRIPETVLEEYSNLRELMNRYNQGTEKPMLSGEWGYSVHDYQEFSIDEHKQAQFLVRQFLTNFLAGTRLSIWYDWKDDGPDPKEKEHHFGTVKTDLSPKEAYRAAQVFTRELHGMNLLRQHFDPQAQAYWAVFGKEGIAKVLVGWTTEKDRELPVWNENPNVEAVSMLGDPVMLKQEQGIWKITLSQDPVYIHLQ